MDRFSVAFSEAGDGVDLRFTFADLAALQSKFGSTYFSESVDRIDKIDLGYLTACLEIGGKKDGKPFPVTLDSVAHMPLAEIGARALDALFLRVHGKSFEEHLSALQAAAAAKALKKPRKAPAETTPSLI